MFSRFSSDNEVVERMRSEKENFSEDDRAEYEARMLELKNSEMTENQKEFDAFMQVAPYQHLVMLIWRMSCSAANTTITTSLKLILIA
jgi:hypothetical protein